MVGWSRRNAESRRRRQRWWASLSEDEKDAHRVGESKFEMAFGELVPWIIFLCLFGAIAIAVHEWPNLHAPAGVPVRRHFLP